MAGVFFRRAILVTAVAQFNSSVPPISVAFAPVPTFTSLCRPTKGVAVQHTIRSVPLMQTMSSSAGRECINCIDKLALILINAKRQQLVARSYNRTVYYTPGGKREAGESDIEALTRECREELSIDLTSSSTTPAIIEPYGTFEAQAYGKPPGTIVRLTCYRITPRNAELELEHLVKASEEVEELKWIDSSFDRERLTVTGVMILEDLKRRELID